MENLFQAIMYKLFGRKWILYMMRQGTKEAIFAYAVDLDRKKIKHEIALEKVEELKDIYEKAPKEGLSKEGQENLKKLTDEYQLASSEELDARQELMGQEANLEIAKARDAHVNLITIKDIEKRYEL